MKKSIIAVFLLLAAVSFAQPDSVILVSDITSVDMLIAKAAGDRTGAPVLVLPGGGLSDDIRAELASLNPKTIILIGGPAVIPEATQTELEGRYSSVVRLWGQERTGTAVEVAKHFWAGGADCVVIADDTKNSDADTEIQAEASEDASLSGCPFLPVPKGEMPAEALDLINTLGTKEARFVGREPSGEFRSKLARLRLVEILGSKEQIEDEIDKKVNTTSELKLIVIAAPNWRDVLGYGGHRGRHTIVRIVSSADTVPRLANLIKTRSIADVRVAGNPTLADAIAAGLEAEGINVTKVSGSSSDVARKLLNATLDEWEKRMREHNDENNALKTRIRAYLSDRLTELETKLNNLESEMESKKAEGGDTAEINGLLSKIDAAKKQLDAIKTYIDNNNLETAKARIAKLFDDVERARWRGRSALGINSDDDIKEEEASVEDNEKMADLGAVEARLASVRVKCNLSSLDPAIEKARTLKQDMATARAAGDYAKAASLSMELKTLVERARSLTNLCEKAQKIDSRLTAAVGKAVQRAEKVRSDNSGSGS